MQKLRTIVCLLVCALVSSSCATPDEGAGPAVPEGSTRRALVDAAKPAALPPLPAEAFKPEPESFRLRFQRFFGVKPSEPTR